MGKQMEIYLRSASCRKSNDPQPWSKACCVTTAYEAEVSTDIVPAGATQLVLVTQTSGGSSPATLTIPFEDQDFVSRRKELIAVGLTGMAIMPYLNCVYLGLSVVVMLLFLT